MRQTLPLGGHHFYDRVVARRLQRFYQQWLPSVAGEHVLDVGCGPGHLAAALASRHAQVTGVDMDPRQVALARRHQCANLRFFRADARELPFDTASMDAVVTTESFHHWRDPEQALAEVRRVLKPGKSFWIVEGAGDMTRDEISTWLGKRPSWFTAWLMRRVFTQHGYAPAKFEAHVVPAVQAHFENVHVERRQGWFVLEAR